MPSAIYEVVAQGARYWFLLLMVLIVLRSWRWYRRDKKQARKRLKLLPDAGFVGEMVVITGGKGLERGSILPVPREGTLGTARTNDLCVPLGGVSKRHLWFRFEDDKGLFVEPYGKNAVNVDGENYANRRYPLYMAHGSRLYVGECELRLRLFAGFESIGHAQRAAGVETDVQPQQEEPEAQQLSEAQQMPMDYMQYAAMQQKWLEEQLYAMQQQAYQQGYQQAMQQAASEEEALEEADPESLPFEMAQIAQEEGMVDHSLYMRPEGVKKPELPQYEPEPAPDAQTFYAPVQDDEEDDWPYAPDPIEDWTPYDEDMTDAAAPPKSAYVGHDESEIMKKHVWDKYFGGGHER